MIYIWKYTDYLRIGYIFFSVHGGNMLPCSTNRDIRGEAYATIQGDTSYD